MLRSGPVALVLAAGIFGAACSSGGTDDSADVPTTGDDLPATAASPELSTTLSEATVPVDVSTTSEVAAPSSPPPAAETSTTVETAAPSAADPATCVDDLTVGERAALLVWPSVDADNWPEAVDTVRANDIGGALLMSQSGLDENQVRDRLAELEAASRHGLIIATDEEGGDVQRLRNLGPLDSQRQISENLSAAGAADVVADHGAIVRSVGVDMVLGPVVDVEPNAGEVPLQPSRFFSGGPERVTEYASAYIDGWSRADLFATLKHYPGHGAASGDTHISEGVTPSLDDLREFDLEPYQDLVDRAAGADTAVMIGHLTVPGLTDGRPATQSPAAISYLRDDLGYGDALLVTDALGMAAVGIPEPEASVLALGAGIDVVIFTLTSQTAAVIDAIEQAVSDGRIDPEHLDRAARKVMTMLGRDGHTCNSNRSLFTGSTTSHPST